MFPFKERCCRKNKQNKISATNLDDEEIVPSTAYQELHRERFKKL